MDVQVVAQPTTHDVGSDGMGSTGGGAGRVPVSATRQCVCGGWTRYIVCQYCGTTDPHASAAGMISMTPLVQRSPEEAAAHSAGAAPGSTAGYDGGGALWEPGSQPPSPTFEAGTHAAPPLPPTTFAEAQFGEAPSAAAAFASTADLPTAPAGGAFSAPAFAAPAFPAPASPPTAFSPVGSAPEVTPPTVPGWSSEPAPAPPGWATAATPAPGHYEPGAAPAPLSGFDGAMADYPPIDNLPAEYTPTGGATPFTDYEPPAPSPVSAGPQPVAYPVPPTSYEIPAEVAAPPVQAPQPEPAAVRARRPLPRWTVPAAAAVVVLGGAGLYLGTRGGSSDSTSVPVVPRHVVASTHAAPSAAAPSAVAPAPAVAPATLLTGSAPAGFTATGPARQVAAGGLPAADSLHSAAELATAGVTSATVTTFTGPGGVKVTALIEPAGSPAQAGVLATHAHHFGFTMQAANGSDVYALHALGKSDALVAAFTSWTAKLHG